jgi:hypothetical protein
MNKINNREYTRHNFAPMMWVKVLRKGSPVVDFKMYQLIDISQGGISFKSHAANEFKRKDQFQILEVEGKKLDRPLRAVVKYVQYLDEFGIDFKVGVEFIKE